MTQVRKYVVKKITAVSAKNKKGFLIQFAMIYLMLREVYIESTLQEEVGGHGSQA
jgi:hypothetical protein